MASRFYKKPHLYKSPKTRWVAQIILDKWSYLSFFTICTNICKISWSRNHWPFEKTPPAINENWSSCETLFFSSNFPTKKLEVIDKKKKCFQFSVEIFGAKKRTLSINSKILKMLLELMNAFVSMNQLQIKMEESSFMNNKTPQLFTQNEPKNTCQ